MRTPVLCGSRWAERLYLVFVQLFYVFSACENRGGDRSVVEERRCRVCLGYDLLLLAELDRRDRGWAGVYASLRTIEWFHHQLLAQQEVNVVQPEPPPSTKKIPSPLRQDIPDRNPDPQAMTHNS